ncbi:MAG: enoyl-CoA hydratase-related protein [Bacteroidota bacterium]
MSFQTLLYDVSGNVATITINRPDKLNALNAQTKAELLECLTAIKNDSAVAVVIITGAGPKSFVAGTDIAELQGLNSVSGREFAAGGQAVFHLIENLGKPVIAAVNGYALGGGCELALACHIRIAAENAKFGQPEVNLGIIPGYGGTQRLARLIGRGRAMEMILTGVQVDAQEASRIGLVNKVVPAGELMPRARAMAELIASFGQIAIRMALKAVNMTEETPQSEGERLEASLFGACCDTQDFVEGTRAFLEKRKPVFRNA